MIRAAHLEAPLHDLAMLVLDIQIKPRMGIDPFDPRDGPGNLDRVIAIEDRRKRMVRCARPCD